MSRLIENDHPFSEEEISYLQGRRRIRDIELNEKKFGKRKDDEPSKPVESPGGVELSEETVEYVKKLDDDQLKLALEKMSVSLPDDASEKQARFALAEAIQRNKDAQK